MAMRKGTPKYEVYALDTGTVVAGPLSPSAAKRMAASMNSPKRRSVGYRRVKN